MLKSFAATIKKWNKDCYLKLSPALRQGAVNISLINGAQTVFFFFCFFFKLRFCHFMTLIIECINALALRISGCCRCPRSIESHKFKLAKTINNLLMVSWDFTAFSWECRSADAWWTVTNDGEKSADRCSDQKKTLSLSLSENRKY